MPAGNVNNYQGAANSSNVDVIENGFDRWIKFYNDTGGALSNGAIKQIAYEVDATDTSNPIIRAILKAPATEAVSVVEIAVVDNSPLGEDTVASTDYGYAKVRGYVLALCDGTNDIAVGDQLEILNAATAFIVGASASSGDSGVLVDECAAIAMEAYTLTVEATKKVLLVGRPCVVKSS